MASLSQRGRGERAVPNRRAGDGIADAAAGSPCRHGVLRAAVLAASGERFRIAAAKTPALSAAKFLAVLSFAGCVNLTGAAGLNGFAANSRYNEKEQSTDSAGTDVGKEYNGRAGGILRLRSSVAPSCLPAQVASGQWFEGGNLG